MKRQKITNLNYIGSGKFRAELKFSHTVEITGSVNRIPYTAVCSVCNQGETK